MTRERRVLGTARRFTKEVVVRIVGFCIAIAILVGRPMVAAGEGTGETVYRTPDGVMSLVAPAGWEPNDAIQNPFASIKLSHDKQAFAMVISEHKRDFSQGLTLEEYARKVQRLPKPKDYETISISEPTQLEINGNRAIQYVVRLTFKDVHLTQIQTYYETRTRFSQLMCWTLPSRLDQERGDFDVMIRSFRQRPTPPAKTTR